MKYIFILFLLFLYSCNLPPSKLNKNEFPVSPGTSLAFDLGDSKNIKAAILVSGSEKVKEKSIILPFKSLNFENNLEILSVVGNYEQFTLTKFATDQLSRGKIDAIYFTPFIKEFEYAETFNQKIENGVYLIRNGFDRQFVYNYDYFKNENFENTKKHIRLDSLDFIAVKMPDKSNGAELENGKTTIPDCILTKEKVKVFPGTYSGKLMVSYRMDTDSHENNWLYLLAKIYLLLIVPAFEFIFIIGFVRDQKTKRIAIIIGSIIELGIIFGIITFGIMGHFIGIDKMIDSLTSGITGLMAIILIYYKDKKTSL